MNEAVRVLERPLSLVPASVRGTKDQIADFLGTRLPADFKINETDAIQLLGKDQMEELMLERAPFYFIEKAVAINTSVVWAAATMTVERSAGHFPGRPIVPLIELCKATAQAGIVVAALQGQASEAPIAISAGESRALAKDLIEAPVRILICVTLMQSRMRLHFVDGVTYIDGAKVGSLVKIVYTLMDRQRILTKN